MGQHVGILRLVKLKRKKKQKKKNLKNMVQKQMNMANEKHENKGMNLIKIDADVASQLIQRQ